MGLTGTNPAESWWQYVSLTSKQSSKTVTLFSSIEPKVSPPLFCKGWSVPGKPDQAEKHEAASQTIRSKWLHDPRAKRLPRPQLAPLFKLLQLDGGFKEIACLPSQPERLPSLRNGLKPGFLWFADNLKLDS